MISWDEWANLDGFIEPKEGFLLYNEVLKLPCSSLIIEIGCYHGKSTTALLWGCKDSSCKAGERSRVRSVDPFIGQGMSTGEVNAEEQFAGENAVYQLVNGYDLRDWFIGVDKVKSDDWFAAHTELLGTVNMFFIDGLHPNAGEDVKHAIPYLKKGGIIVCHDYWPYSHPLDWITKLIDSAGLKFVRLEDTNLGKAVIL